ncbi:MAG: response regulator [Lentisphaeria bacterium]|nr:response regulator [Lentisphaeria bacterium]
MNKPILLYIDDQIDVYQATCIFLQSKGYEILKAHSPELGLKILNEKTVDLVLLDINMPGMDGYEVCEQIRTNPKTKSLPVIFSTVCDLEEEIARCFEVGGNDYVSKQLRPAELSVRIKTQLDLYKLKEEEEFRNSLMKNVLDIRKEFIFIVTSDLEVIYANDAAETYFEAELLGKKLTHFLSISSAEHAAEVIYEGIQKHTQFEKILPFANGTRHVAVYPMHDVKLRQKQLFIVVNSDISKIKVEKKMLEQIQRMDSLTSLAGGVAHDLNNTLGGIFGYLSLIESNTKPNDPSRVMLQKISQACDKASSTVYQLLEFSQFANVTPQMVELDSVLKECMQEAIEEFPTELKFNAQIQPNLELVYEPKEIIHGLFKNMILAAEKNFKELTSMSVSLIAKKVHHHVEVNFVIVVPMTRDLTKNLPVLKQQTGLSVAIIKDIIKHYNGSFECQHTASGSLELRLNIAFKAYEEKGNLLKQSSYILVIDDEPIILKMIDDCFDLLGYNGYYADSGIKGIQLYEQHQEQISLVVLDLMMPGMTGHEVIQKIREINPRQKVLIASAHHDFMQSQIIQELCPNDYLKKPFRLDELKNKIEMLLD